MYLFAKLLLRKSSKLKGKYWTTQLTFTCSKSTKVTLQKTVNSLVYLLLTLNILHTFFWYFYIDFEQVNVSWVRRIFGTLVEAVT